MLIFLVIFLVFATFFLWTAISGAPWVPARTYDIEQLLDDTKLSKGEVFYELGCGDGRLVKAAAQRGAYAVGYELNPFLWLIARFRTMGTKNTKIILGDLWQTNLRNADVVMAFLVLRTVPRLEKKAAGEMKVGSRLVSYIFPLPHKKPSHKAKSWLVYEY